MTLRVRILRCSRRLFIILVSLTMTRFSEKMLISTRCIHGFMSNLIKKSWTDSNYRFLCLDCNKVSKGYVEFLWCLKPKTSFCTSILSYASLPGRQYIQEKLLPSTYISTNCNQNQHSCLWGAKSYFEVGAVLTFCSIDSSISSIKLT